MSYQTVLAIDPGESTGLAFFSTKPDEPATLQWHGQVDGGLRGFADEAHLIFYKNHDRIDHVVIEGFELDGRTMRPNIMAREIIGFVKGIVAYQEWETGFGPKFGKQTNTQGKAEMTDAVLKRTGYHPKRGEVKGGHSRDAIRHGLTYIAHTLRHEPTRLLLFPKED